MNKSAQTTLLKELVYLVIGVIALFILIFVIGPKLLAAITNTPDKESINNFERLATELDLALSAVDQPGFDLMTYSKSIPVNINNKVGIRLYNPEWENLPRECTKGDSLCICIAYVKVFEENGNPFKCKSLENGKGINIDDTDVDMNSAGLIVTNGISAYVVTFLDFSTIRIEVRTSENEESRSITSASAYMSFSDFCSGDADCLAFRAFDGSSKSPKGSPFGEPSIRITSGYLAEGYAQFIMFNNLKVNIRHLAIDMVPSQQYYGSKYNLKGKPVFFAICDGNATGDTDSNGGNFVRLYCADGKVILYYHNQNNFVREKVPVSYGQPLGIMGNTGNSAGAHIHFKISDNTGTLNPFNFIARSSINQNGESDPEILCQIDRCTITERNPNPRPDCINSCYPTTGCKYICKAK